MKETKDVNLLTSIDKFGGRLAMIPAEVRGYWRRRREIVHFILLAIFLLVPWLKFRGYQLIHLNIPLREFTFFGMHFKAHDAPLIFFLLIAFALGLALVTAIWGRVWCGWACPQTVFIDAVYRRLEIFAEGKYLERRRLNQASWGLNKIWRRSLKWGLFTLVSALIAHSFIAYFTGSNELLRMMQAPPQDNWTYFVLVMSFTGALLFNFGWFREQFCVIMCPYGRIQSVLLEPSSLAVVYNAERGEPRRGVGPGPFGSCVDCSRCVQVCPTGIDIRNGLQMECIACTACIDACDEIMVKTNQPTGLISYRTLDGGILRFFKPKTIVYGILVILALGTLAFNLQTRNALHMTVLRAIESPYTINQDRVLNHFRLHLTNQSKEQARYKILLRPEDEKAGIQMTVAQPILVLAADGSETWHVFISAPLSLLPANGQGSFGIVLEEENNPTHRYEQTLTLIGPRS